MNRARFRAWRFLVPGLDAPENAGGLLIAATGGIAMVQADDAVRQGVLLLLSTVPGERVMRPDYGCLLHRLIFSPNDDTTAGLAIHYVRMAVERWEPRIDVLRIDATRVPEQAVDSPLETRRSIGAVGDMLYVTLVYRVRATRQVGTVTLPVKLAGPEALMPLPVPNLDDRSFDQLVREAQERIVRSCPGWTDLSASDPGMVLVDVFAYLTDVMLYRLNRLPEKAYIEFLNLIGVRIQPPAAARVILRFHRETAASQAVTIPRGTRVTLARPDAGTEAPVFVTTTAATISAGANDADVLALHCDMIDIEQAGKGTGLPGQSVAVSRPPIIGPTEDGLDLVVGVEAASGELGERVPAFESGDKTYRVWREVPSFTNVGADGFVYVADRAAGLITFAPAARTVAADGHLSDQPQPLAEIPMVGRQILVSYRRGGGAAGNVIAGTLTTLKDAVPGVNLQVVNPEAASGGRAAETPENAGIRGPQALHSLQGVVTATDYERVATLTASGIARARAFTRAAVWRFAQPGTVEVLLVPDVPESQRPDGRVMAATLQQQQTEAARVAVQYALEQRRPLGTVCLVNWAHYKSVRVSARIVVRREEDPEAVRGRVLSRLHQTINPLPTALNVTGWRFGQALRASNIYDIALREPGVRWIDSVELQVEQVPEMVSCMAADPFQVATWYAGSGSLLYRSLNDGESWEPVGQFPGGQVTRVQPHPEQPGLLAVIVRPPDDSSSNIFMSRDCGETWEAGEQSFAFVVQDLAWTVRDDVPILLLATDRGLYEFALRPDGSPVQVVVDPANQSRPLYAVATVRDVRGPVSVAVATRSAGGIFLSTDGGRAGSFSQMGLQGNDVRVLAVQRDGPRSFLWAGQTVAGGDEGKGCWRWELTGGETPPNRWEAFSKGWIGGSVRALAFLGTTVVAATHHTGVMRLDARTVDAAWQQPEIRCGLPLRDLDEFQFYPLDSIATDAAARLIMVGLTARDATGERAEQLRGVFRSDDGGDNYKRVSERTFSETVRVPSTWLLCSGEHEIVVEGEDAASSD